MLDALKMMAAMLMMMMGGTENDDDNGNADDGGNVRVLARVPGGRFGRPEERETRLDSRWRELPNLFNIATLIIMSTVHHQDCHHLEPSVNLPQKHPLPEGFQSALLEHTQQIIMDQ